MLTLTKAQELKEKEVAVMARAEKTFTNRDRFLFVLLTIGIWAIAQLWVLGLPLWVLNYLFGG